jgi:type IV pilus assembly protein PilV
MLMARKSQRGVGLFDALVAMAILAFGMLALVRMQTRLVAQATDSQLRLTASRLADELLNTALVDRSNAGCYVLPSPSNCASPTARDQVAAWNNRVQAELPDGAASATLAASPTANPLTVTLTWSAKGSEDQRTLKVSTDVSP